MPDPQLALSPFEYGGLFSEHFLRERMPAWSELDPARHESLHQDLRTLWSAERAGLAQANEAQTEERCIRPVLARLGFRWTVQSGLPVAGGFLAWLEGWLGARLSRLAGSTALRAYDAHSLDDLLAVLRRNRARLARDPETRAFREEMDREWSASLDRLRALGNSLALDEAAADKAVYELYELPPAQRAMVEAEYGA